MRSLNQDYSYLPAGQSSY